MFHGIQVQEGRYFNIPLELFDGYFAQLSGAELKVLLYIIKHTWGFQNYDTPVHLTVDEIRNGRYQKGRVRMDKGTGLSGGAVSEALKSLIEGGFIVCYTDNTDRGRVKRYFMIRQSDKAPKETMAVDKDGKVTSYDEWLKTVAPQKNEDSQNKNQSRTQYKDKMDMIDKISIHQSIYHDTEKEKENESIDAIKERLKTKYGLNDQDMAICLARMKNKDIKNPIKFLEKVAENYAKKEKVLNEAVSKAVVNNNYNARPYSADYIVPRNYFNSYKDQRKYDVAELEKKLLARSREEEP